MSDTNIFQYDFKNKNVLGNIRNPKIWQFNLAMNMALLSDDAKVVRNFWRTDSRQYLNDMWMAIELNEKFLGKFIPGQAFLYFGLCPMVVQGMQNLVASAGFVCDSDNKTIDDKLNKCIEKNNLQQLFSDGVYYESGLGDFAYRICVDRKLQSRPLIDIIEPQHLRLIYTRQILTTIVIKEPAVDEQGLELHEVYSKNKQGYVVIDHFIYKDSYLVSERDDVPTYEQYLKALGVTRDTMRQITLPLQEFPIIYKQNHVRNMIYGGQRGVPDIQGLMTFEDGLSESISDAVDAIRKGGVKEFVDDSMLQQDADGNTLGYDPFNKTIIKVKGSSLDNKSLIATSQGAINYEAYIETAKYLISSALNKVGISPTTIGITGLESINSSSEAQDTREKPSLRKRKLSLRTWTKTLTDLLNRYLQVCDYMDGHEIYDYTELIHIKFNEYVSPSQESIIDLVTKKINVGVISKVDAIRELDTNLSEEQAGLKLLDIIEEQQLLQGMQSPNDIGNNEATVPLNEEQQQDMGTQPVTSGKER